MSRAHQVYEYDGETDNDAMPDIFRQKPFSTEDLYRFSRVFGLEGAQNAVEYVGCQRIDEY